MQLFHPSDVFAQRRPFCPGFPGFLAFSLWVFRDLSYNYYRFLLRVSAVLCSLLLLRPSGSGLRAAALGSGLTFSV